MMTNDNKLDSGEVPGVCTEHINVKGKLYQ